MTRAAWARTTILLFLGLGLGACAHSQLKQGSSELVIEIFNPQPGSMTVSFATNGAETVLGKVAANETRRWAVPALVGTRIRFTATDEARAHTITGSLNTEKGQVVRWEIRE